VIYALTDETYSLLTMLQTGCERLRSQLQFRLALLNHAYWVIGCTLGAWLGGQISFSTAGIEFTLPALFLVLTLEQYRAVYALRDSLVSGRHLLPALLALGLVTLLHLLWRNALISILAGTGLYMVLIQTAPLP
jgi:4-azaleucine resistance transporter AzlC